MLATLIGGTHLSSFIAPFPATRPSLSMYPFSRVHTLSSL